MKRHIFLLLLLFAGAGSLVAQNNSSVKGIIADTTNKKPVPYAVIALLTPKDSFLYAFTRSDKSGAFRLPAVAPGRYIVQITQSSFADYVDDIEVGPGELDLRSIAITPKSKLLQEVIIKSGSPIKIKGDTIIYTADSFKVGANANVEALLKKMPGIQVDKNGQIKAMGEVVQKVLVDGEEFFGDDPGIAVKNLRADAVKEVQVFDKKSDQAEFTGIDDGQKSKTINLKLKEDRKKGYFGKIELGGGLQKEQGDRYNNAAMINAFKGKRKIAAYTLVGNTGNDGLDWRDEQNYAGQGDQYSVSVDEVSGNLNYSWNGGDDGDVYIDTDQGFTKNWNTGLHYSNKLNENNNINSGLKYNKLNYQKGVNAFSQTFLGDTSFSENSREEIQQQKQQYKFNLSYDLKLDSMNSIRVTGNIAGLRLQTGSRQYSDAVNQLGKQANSSNKLADNTMDKFNLNANMLWKHRFAKPKRSMSLNAEFRQANTDGEGYLQAVNEFYDNGVFLRRDSVDQFKTTATLNQTFNTRLSYTEPLAKDLYGEINYGMNAAISNNDRISFAKTAPGKYEQRIDSLSNNFRQNIITHRGGVNLRYVKKKFNLSAGMGLAATSFALHDLSRKKDYHYNFLNIFPAASLNYTLKPNKTLRFNYNGSTRQPSLNQLQPLRENNNPLNLYTGNPNLKQTFRHGFNYGYNGYNMMEQRGFNVGGSFSFSKNAITNSVTIDNLGRRTTTPVNTNGIFNTFLYTNYNRKIRKLDIGINFGPNIGINRSIDFVNNLRNRSLNFSQGINLSMYKSKDDAYEISLYTNFSRNSNTSSLNPKPVKYFSMMQNFDVTCYIGEKWVVGTEAEFNYRQKTSEFDRNNNNIVWDASVSRFLYKKELVVKLRVDDILNQNNVVDRVITSNYLSESTSPRLQRYWLLTLTWNFSKNGKPSDGD